MVHLLDRHWLITSTTYGTWLPGDERGFVSPVRDEEGGLVIHNVIHTPIDADMPLLKEHAESQLRGSPVYFTRPQAERLLSQFQETCSYRRWRLLAGAVMRNHFHLTVTVPGDPDPSRLMQDFKAYGSRALNECWPRPESGTWWTESGSKRKLPDAAAVRAAVRYVWNQPGWLARYVDGEIPAEWRTPGERGT
jgi:REP element-mobilizing transposase RayT